MGVKLRERPGKGWFVLIDWNGQRKAKCFGKNKKLAKQFADKLTLKLKWTEENGEPLRLSSPNGDMPTIQEYFTECSPSMPSLIVKYQRPRITGETLRIMFFLPLDLGNSKKSSGRMLND